MEVSKTYLFVTDIILEITKYFNDISDYIHFAQINKTFYHLLTLEETMVLNQLFEKNAIKLSNNLPNYLFKSINSLNLIEEENHEFNLLEKFTNLKKLNVKKIPEQYLIKLTNLEELDIDNYFYYSNLSKLNNNLKKLTLFFTRPVTDDYLEKFTNLNELYLSGSTEKLNGKFLQNMNQLKILHLSGSNIEDKYFLNNLTELNIFSCVKVKGNGLQNLKQLKTLIIENEGIINYKESIGNLINLTYLVIYDNSSFQNTNFLQNLINLENLVIVGFDCKDKDFYNLKNLKTLIINGNISGKCFKYLTNLKEVDGELKMEGQYFKYLTNLEKLKIKEIKEPFTIEDFTHLKNIKQLTLTVPTLNDNYLQFLTNLTDLDISGSQSINGDCLKNLVNLKTLNATETNIKDENLINLKKLRELDVTKCMNIIETLTIDGSINIKEEYLENLTNLIYLYINQCPNIVNGKFLLQMTKLEMLSYDNGDSSQWVECYDEGLEEIKTQIREGLGFSEIVRSRENLYW
ncbi:hypothetical protein ABK040_000245 [Willaertia magna]